MVRINLNFTQDVCYLGLHKLLDAIKTGKPEGLKVFGDWETIYPALHDVPAAAKNSWFEFDHYYSDCAFDEMQPFIFAKPVARLFDIGGNTGKWTLSCLAHDDKVQITIVDLPEEIKVAREIMVEKGLSHRVDFYPINLLDTKQCLPDNADVIWMSQFLDCFSESEILSILQRAVV